MSTDPLPRPFSVRWDKLTARYLVGIPDYAGGMVVPIDHAAQEWRAVGKDFEDMTVDPGAWETNPVHAQREAERMRSADPGYDMVWVETRWVTTPISLAEAEKAGV